MYMFICIWSGEAKSNHKRSLEIHVVTHSNARCELTCLELSTCDRITQGMNGATFSSRRCQHLFLSSTAGLPAGKGATAVQLPAIQALIFSIPLSLPSLPCCLHICSPLRQQPHRHILALNHRAGLSGFCGWQENKKKCKTLEKKQEK